MPHVEYAVARTTPNVGVRRGTIVATVLGLLVMLGAFAPAAMAGNTGRCRPAFKVGSQYRNYCSLWRGHVPVYERPWDNTTGSQDWAAQRGELIHGGYANWFWGQVRNTTYQYGAYYNNWWAYTMADNGKWGYVPLVFFSGGANNEASLMPCKWFDPYFWGNDGQCP